MAELGIIGASLGLANLAVQKIIDLHDFSKNVKNAPQEIERLQSETATLMLCLDGLKGLDTEDDELQGLMKEIGVPNAVESCNTACGDLQSSLERWTKKGPESFRTKLRIASNRTAIDKGIATIITAKGTLNVAMGAVNLSIDAGRREEEARRHQAEMSRWSEDAEGQFSAASRAMSDYRTSLADPEDPDDTETRAIENLGQIQDTYGQYWANCGKAAKQVKENSQLDQLIIHIISDEGAQVFVGMPKEVNYLVDKQEIIRVHSGKNSHVRIGVF